ncbi:uncharacterized protein LOC110254725 [Exaiptasia diaphana]|uniref:Uncharacterized protein n=1 Tax=Exaiptasia diaphana TaxID=2652724 RepID=A0A913YAR2_EXADI|nr:uncharacterized protein LOC110254725 [Exaiptasia diaphana]
MMADSNGEEDSSVFLTEKDDPENIFFEIDVVFSKKAFLSSCSSKQDQVCCPVIPSSSNVDLAVDTESVNDDKAAKTRKFKNIALPNWLVKPHAKKSNDDRVFAKHFNAFHSNKKKMLRTNSAPKKLVSGGVKMEYQHCSTIDEGTEGLSDDHHTLRPRSPVIFGKQIVEEGKEKSKGHVWRRRASLPAHVGKIFSDGIKVTDSSGHVPLTPEAPRKRSSSPTDKMEKDVLKTLIFGKSHHGTAKTSYDKPLNAEQNSINGDSNTDLTNEKTTHMSNHKLEVPRLQLHRLETPDLFYVPDMDEDCDTVVRLDKKISVSAGELRTATKIDSEKLEIELIKSLITQDLKNYLEDKTFIPDLCQKWCSDLSQTIKNSVQSFKGNDYKIVCVVYIAAIRGNGIHAAVQCLWTPEQDCFTTASYTNESLYAFGSLMAIKYD